MDWLIYVIYALIIAAQGGVVFATARFIRRRAGGQRWQSKVFAMLASYLGWVALTMGSVLLFGLVGGLMEGLLLVLFLWFTGTIASLIYLFAWLIRRPSL